MEIIQSNQVLKGTRLYRWPEIPKSHILNVYAKLLTQIVQDLQCSIINFVLYIKFLSRIKVEPISNNVYRTHQRNSCLDRTSYVYATLPSCTSDTRFRGASKKYIIFIPYINSRIDDYGPSKHEHIAYNGSRIYLSFVRYSLSVQILNDGGKVFNHFERDNGIETFFRLILRAVPTLLRFAAKNTRILIFDCQLTRLGVIRETSLVFQQRGRFVGSGLKMSN